MSTAKCQFAGYRPGIGIMLLSRGALAFVGHRIRMPEGLAKWQMPQGGIMLAKRRVRRCCVN